MTIERDDLLRETRRTFNVLYRKSDVAELRIPDSPWGTLSGFFNNARAMREAAAGLDGKVPAIYCTLNPLKPALLIRAPNQLVYHASSAAKDRDVRWRRSFLIDIDPVRPSGVSSTDAEHEAALARAREVRTHLSAKGWPDPVLADSGNGAHLIYLINRPNDESSRAMIRHCLKELDALFTDDAVKIDKKVFNAARIVKVYGTWTAKGEDTPGRPHRRSRIIEVPE